MKLYRYVRALSKDEYNNCVIDNWIKNILIDSRLYFSHPATFNDPLECVIPIKIEGNDYKVTKYQEDTKEVLKEIVGAMDDVTDRNKRIYEAIDYGAPIENCLVACLSCEKNNQLLWSHYADQHRGICICYEFPDEFELFDKEVRWSSNIELDRKKWGLNVISAPVDYKMERPYILVDDGMIRNNYNIENAIFIKPKCWNYEKEWRLVLLYPFGSTVAFAAGINTIGYYVTLPQHYLKEITFGLRLEDSYCLEFMKIIENSGYKDVKFNKAQMKHNRFEIVSEPYVNCDI